MRLLTLILLLAFALSVNAQEGVFIGCRNDSGWAETPMLRKTFTITADDLRNYDFKVDVVSLGYHEVYVNGYRVDDYVLQPAVSQLDKRALRVSYDITKYIHEGENEIVLWIGQGWGRIYDTPSVVSASVSQFIGIGDCREINLLLSTDTSWSASPSPYSYTGSWQPLQFGGERYDARVKPDWRPAAVYNGTQASLPAISSQEFSGNRIVNTLFPQSVDTLADGTFLIDFGRVVTGWFQIDCLPIPEGDVITMEYLDHLNAKPPHTETDIYVSDGSGDDDIHFTNRFHTHSFRFVKVKGLSHYLNLNIPIFSARALQISAVDPFGGASFECSDQRLNAIHDMVKYTLSCLTFSGYMVDCPHLERMGYGGDGNSSTNTLQTLWDVRDTYRNWLAAWSDAMQPDGELPYVAPAFRTGGGPYWSGFVVMAPWNTYVNYGDRTLIDKHYDAMKLWMDFVEAHSVDGILRPWPDNERHSWFLGDWLAPDGVDIGGESVLHVSSCFVADCLSKMYQMALLTGHSDDALLFALRRQRVAEAIHSHFYHPEINTYANGTPLDQCYALLLGIPPDSATAAAVKSRLLNDIHAKYRDHIAVGLMGVPVFTEWCVRNRETDLMATILRQPDYPGYLRMMNCNINPDLNLDQLAATKDSLFNSLTYTTWESWGCGLPDHEDRSRVHNCYNGVGIWFYQALAGIRPDPQRPGYSHFFIDPQPCEGIDRIHATKPTLFGDIVVEIADGILSVTVPPGTTATAFPSSANETLLLPGLHKIYLKR